LDWSVEMAIEVIVTDEFKAWYEGLSEDEQDRVYRTIGLLEIYGVTLGFPHSSAIEGASFALRELRTQVKGDPLRTLYAFDPSRQAVLLIGGDKTGDDRFYEHLIPVAEKLWWNYLEETGQAKPKKK
jgi:hypothetical protein